MSRARPVSSQSTSGTPLKRTAIRWDRMRKELEESFSFMSYAPILFISAKTGQRLDKLFETIHFVDVQNGTRIPDRCAQRDAGARHGPGTAAFRPKASGSRSSTSPRARPARRRLSALSTRKLCSIFRISAISKTRIRENFGLTGTPIRMMVREHGDRFGAVRQKGGEIHMSLQLIGASLLAALEGYVLWQHRLRYPDFQLFFHDDVRTHGSGSAGMTNMLRTYGIPAGAATAIGDVAKGRGGRVHRRVDSLRCWRRTWARPAARIWRRSLRPSAT